MTNGEMVIFILKIVIVAGIISGLLTYIGMKLAEYWD